MLLNESRAVLLQQSKNGIKELNHNFEACIHALAIEHGLPFDNDSLQKVANSLNIRWYKHHFVIPAKTTVADLAEALK